MKVTANLENITSFAFESVECSTQPKDQTSSEKRSQCVTVAEELIDRRGRRASGGL